MTKEMKIAVSFIKRQLGIRMLSWPFNFSCER
jgi:hypothetical protein